MKDFPKKGGNKEQAVFKACTHNTHTKTLLHVICESRFQMKHTYIRSEKNTCLQGWSAEKNLYEL
eukprot:scaffold5451_cov117-Skeletonema_dohrnii-CCMP3373.AAC.2